MLWRFLSVPRRIPASANSNTCRTCSSFPVGRVCLWLGPARLAKSFASNCGPVLGNSGLKGGTNPPLGSCRLSERSSLPRVRSATTRMRTEAEAESFEAPIRVVCTDWIRFSGPNGTCSTEYAVADGTDSDPRSSCAAGRRADQTECSRSPGGGLPRGLCRRQDVRDVYSWPPKANANSWTPPRRSRHPGLRAGTE